VIGLILTLFLPYIGQAYIRGIQYDLSFRKNKANLFVEVAIGVPVESRHLVQGLPDGRLRIAHRARLRELRLRATHLPPTPQASAIIRQIVRVVNLVRLKFKVI
jgi:hypothetical protein